MALRSAQRPPRSDHIPQTSPRSKPTSNSTLRDALGLQALGCPVEVETELGWLTVMSWETGRLHRLLANHPDHRIRLPDWALPDFAVIRGWCDDCSPINVRDRCQHAWPTPILPPKSRTRLHRGAREKGFPAVERIVQALASTGCMPVVRGAFKWRAMCPICRMRGKPDRRVYVERDPATSRERLSTFCHCDLKDILAVLGLLPREAKAWNG